MSNVITPSHNIDPSKIQLAIDKLNELEKTNQKLRLELMKLSVTGGFDAVYTEMINRGLLP
ncbi:MAG: hypothetical protein Q8R58_08355 [Sulfuricurvum sp.]|nr:hypothetical protein [Sulfuricurvum sp.]